MRTLTLNSLAQVTSVKKPDIDTQVKLHTSALAVFTDFARHSPVLIDASASAVQVEELMHKAHVKLMLVVDQHEVFVGIISLADVGPDQIIREVASGKSRNEVAVADLMQSKSQLQALGLDDIRHATVAELLNTLREVSSQHILVLDEATQDICGLVSASDLARKLHIAVSPGTVPVFASLYHAVNKPQDLRRTA